MNIAQPSSVSSSAGKNIPLHVWILHMFRVTWWWPGFILIIGGTGGLIAEATGGSSPIETPLQHSHAVFFAQLLLASGVSFIIIAIPMILTSRRNLVVVPATIASVGKPQGPLYMLPRTARVEFMFSGHLESAKIRLRRADASKLVVGSNLVVLVNAKRPGKCAYDPRLAQYFPAHAEP